MKGKASQGYGGILPFLFSMYTSHFTLQPILNPISSFEEKKNVK